MRTVEADAVSPRAAVEGLSPNPAIVVSPTPAGLTKPKKLLHGFASWYGGAFNGRKTASGEVYDMNGLTACHPTLPFGTRVKVVNLRNHRSVVVRITDRGLLYGRRVIDLSYGAAARLDMTQTGVAPVTLQVLQPGEEIAN